MSIAKGEIVITGQRESVLLEAVETLLAARRDRAVTDLSAALLPVDMDEVYFVQDAMAATYGVIGGWKIGAPGPEAMPLFAPMPLAWMARSGSELTGARWRYRGLEAEIAFLVGEDLPPRATPYTREEALGAMASCHPAIEVLESAFVDPMVATKTAWLADMQIHGGFVPGPAIDDWQAIDFATETVTLAVDGVVRVERTGSNTAGDLLRLLPWLANEGATRTGGLRKGQWITTGSWTGNTPASSRARVDVQFTRAGAVDLRFA